MKNQWPLSSTAQSDHKDNFVIKSSTSCSVTSWQHSIKHQCCYQGLTPRGLGLEVRGQGLKFQRLQLTWNTCWGLMLLFMFIDWHHRCRHMVIVIIILSAECRVLENFEGLKKSRARGQDLRLFMRTTALLNTCHNVYTVECTMEWHQCNECIRYSSVT